MRANALPFRSLALALTFCATTSLQAQRVLTYPNITVEVFGLRRWTLQMVQDSLAKYSPSDSLHKHGCAAALRYKVGFADAAVMEYEASPTQRHLVVILREPQDSARVRYRPVTFDTAGARPEWKGLISAFVDHRQPFLFAVRNYPDYRGGKATRPSLTALGADSLHVLRVWSMLANRTTSRDRDMAELSLLGDPNFRNRIVAAAILANFSQQDRAWWALAEAMRESDGIVKDIAASTAVGMSRLFPRTVDWAPVLPAIRTMLDGTSPFSFLALLEVLHRTHFPSSQGLALLAGGDQMLFEYVGSQQPTLREPVHAFLKRMSGADYGYDVARWRKWAARIATN